MRWSFSEREQAFRIEVRRFLADNLPASLARKVRFGRRLTRDDYVGWQDILASRNWYAIGWPEAAGGPGLTPNERYLFEREYGARLCPKPCQFGIAMAGPVIFKFGTQQQKERFLPRIRNNIDFWCQGYSEPNAGSDLAALKTSARRDGQDYVVNGQKIWTTWAHWADWMFCLVRTDTTGKPQSGISLLLIDMRSSGIEVRPIRTIDGDTEFNEVFFDDVRVPADNLVGEEGQGWRYAKSILEHERFSMSESARSRRILGELTEDADRAGALADPLFRHKLARLNVELSALEFMELNLLSRANAGDDPGPEVSKLKIRGSEIAQALSAIRLALHGAACLVSGDDDPDPQRRTAADSAAATALPTYLNLRKLSIWAGSNEIQRGILAKHVLGLGAER